MADLSSTLLSYDEGSVVARVPRVVVCAPHGSVGHLELPDSRLDPDCDLITGGERSLYAAAFGACRLGYDVELRGRISPPIFNLLRDTLGVAPTVGMDARFPVGGEVIVIPEASEKELYMAVSMSRAVGVVYVLGPPGLCGWSMFAGWEPPEITTVPISMLATPPMYRSLDALGFTLWTNSHGIADAGRRAGVDVVCLGEGAPVPFPDAPVKTHDVAVIEANRWYGDAARLLERLGDDVSVLSIPRVVGKYSLCDELAPARMLLWPSRVEGSSTISREARAVGTVPVTLGTNPFATAEDLGGGIVVCDDEEGIIGEVRSLLGDPVRWAALSDEAVRTAREQADWGSFCTRLGEALSHLPGHVGDSARGELGDVTRNHLATRKHEFANLRAELEEAQARIDVLEDELGRRRFRRPRPSQGPATIL